MLSPNHKVMSENKKDQKKDSKSTPRRDAPTAGKANSPEAKRKEKSPTSGKR